jgi:cell division protein FtsZ
VIGQTMDSFIQAANDRVDVPKNKFKHHTDAELESLLASTNATIKVIGCGGAGNNTLNRITEVGVSGIETIAINTDAQNLLFTSADHKILIGKELTKGQGAGSHPKVGEEAAKEQAKEIREALKGADLVFITAGMGGGTGTGSAPVVAQIAKDMGALTIGIVTVPFQMEGNSRYENAKYGLSRMVQHVDTLIVIPNDKLIEIAPNLPIRVAFKIADEILTNAVKGISELVTKPGLVNLDFADIRTIMGSGGVALIGVGESSSKDRAVEAVHKAIHNPLLDVSIAGATGALINVAGNNNLTLEEAQSVVTAISSQLDDEARIIWGTQIDDDLGQMLRVMIVVTGVKSSQIVGKFTIANQKKDDKKKFEEELGIEFVN